MCGIVGAVAQRDIAPILLAGLTRLEYRGYDSAGMAVIDAQAKLDCRRAVGKVHKLAEDLAQNPLYGTTGIAHTRWATHGKPITDNAHPHVSHARIAVVHNGIIENYETLRRQLTTAGYHFKSATDTEVVAHLLHQELLSQPKFLNALQAMLKQLAGAYALAVIDTAMPEQLFAVRVGSPVVIGLGIGENFVASDHLALLPVVQRFIYLEEGDIACLTRHHVVIYDYHGTQVERAIKTFDFTHDLTDRGAYRHYMLKEIFEQPLALANTLEGRLKVEDLNVSLWGLNAPEILSKVKAIQIAACGTSYHAGLVARHWLEALAGVACQVEIASELRYRQPVVKEGTLLITLSQSGETADTLAAQRMAKSLGYIATLAICNVAESSLIREADLRLLMHAGPEIGVASTKAFTSQLVCLLLLTLILADLGKKSLPPTLLIALRKLPKQIEQILSLNNRIQQLAEQFAHTQHTIFMGRGLQYPIALEGALKLKEISYIHAEGYAGGELKHGPLALLDKAMPVIALAPSNALWEKLKSNIQEVQARGAPLFIFTDVTTMQSEENVVVIPMPIGEAWLTPILYTIPLQLLAYHVAVLKGTDVDQPRHLAKSVTVE